MKRIVRLLAILAGFALGWWIIARLLEWMSPKPVPVEGMRQAEVSPYEMTPTITPTVPSEEETLAVEEPAEAVTPSPEEQASDEAGSGSVSREGEPSEAVEEAPIAYCLRCREKQPLEDWNYETMESGRRRLVGTCSVCGGRVSQFA